MSFKIPNDEDVIIWIIIGTFSTWGGVVRYIIDMKKDKIRWDCKEATSQMIVSSFTGFLGGFLSFESGVSLYMTFVISGLFGTMGSTGISYLWKRFFNVGDKK
ncbi:hypothetical protein Ppb6_02239 [Photorhabdus australis subsp. thailandensis]|uniref:Holin n=1 Tax=Photorhabdus australis subsp. thailandensis TaxID=2805096 RepID=A0A1C0U3N6_9GAMM|nr:MULTISPECIES: phage holin family protein [Photorhabdus]NRN29487.1 holin [Photorhabdus heterorhabditis subsp. aluminescens]OCQ52503.1 hypothetical protein Ppb6_02239 [Photorhabdus australis subsp. thailandensis]